MDPPDKNLLELDGAPFSVEIAGVSPDRSARTFRVTGPTPDGTATHEYGLPNTGHAAYLDLFEGLSRDFHIRFPSSRLSPEAGPASSFQAVLTEAVSPKILYGYGDPSVLRVTGENGEPTWRLLVTSNDAPDAFPILTSDDLVGWRLSGFAFPQGRTPRWALVGEALGDFWAPEMHRVGDAYWVCFAAREQDRSLAIGIARSSSPDGPFEPDERPIVRGGVIDPHIAFDRTGSAHLIWKKDDNDLWPQRLSALLHRRADLVPTLFQAPEDQRTALLVRALWPWARTLEPMERFFVLQPLIEAVTADLAGFELRLKALAAQGDIGLAAEARAISESLRTRIYAQRLAPDGRSLVGAPTVILQNDQPWEAHLIEGVWVTEHRGRYYLIYAGNDFSTPSYGIGAAVADELIGPYVKAPEPLVRSTADWSGPGHPSIAIGPDGRHRMFLHAFPPGRAGYKAFRALLSVAVSFEDDRILLG